MPKKQPPKIGQFHLAARNDVPDFRDYIYEPALIRLKTKLAVPKSLNIRHQGSQNSCTGFGLAAVIDRLIRRNGRRISVSSRMLYEMARKYDKWSGEEDLGSSCRGAIKGWYNMGVCRESLYPYDKPESKYSIKAAKNARENTIGAYYRLGTRISDYHAALTEVGAIYCSANVHDGWDKPDPESGEISLSEKNPGGHAFAIVGYDQHGFWVQNSWGSDWGKNGTALWTYEDWLANIFDAWVFRMALPTPQIWHLPVKSSPSASAAQKSKKPARAEIAGHFVHVDDGHFNDKGRYWSNLGDVKLTANLVAKSSDYDHLLFYAHGGLNSPVASARRIAAMKETFKKNGIYPYHLMYDTGILEELKDVLIGKRKHADERAGGLKDWMDTIVEKLTRVPGRALWREMKAGAELPFKEEEMAGSQTLAAFIDAFKSEGSTKKIHLVGHSTGMILISHLLKRLAVLSPRTAVDTVSLLAPAGTIELFTELVQPYLKSDHPDFRIRKMNIYNLNDELEQDDRVTRAYNKSLLYLVSQAFEEDIPEKILGMEKFSKTTVKRRNLPRLSVHYSEGKVPGARITASETHGGFDNDPVTMNHVLERVLRSAGQDPVLEFTRESLEY